MTGGLLGCTGDEVGLALGRTSKDPRGTTSPKVTASPSPSPTPAESGSGGQPTPGPSPTVTFIDIVPFGGSLNAPHEDGSNPAGYPIRLALSAVVRLSNGATDNRVTWSSDDPSRATVSPTGEVSSVVGAQPGSVTITARAQRDPRQANSVVIQIKTLGNAAVSIF